MQDCSVNANVFSEIYLKYRWPIYLFIRKYIYKEEDAQDLTEDTFEKAMEALRKQLYTPEKHFSAWLYEIAQNKVKDFLKSPKNQLKQSIEPELEETLPAPPPAPASEPVLAAHIDEALATLTEKNRYIFIRRALDCKTFEEIGAELKPKLKEDAVRKRFDRACEKLQPRLKFLKGRY
jgi:RNA polymerase sigma-70 factor (ECF subfamily)